MSLSLVAALAIQLGSVHSIGEMRKVMRDGDLTNHFTLANLSSRQSVYGIGPLGGLSGEVMMLDGQAFVSTVKDGKPFVEQRGALESPFFVWSTVPVWREVRTRDVRSLMGLEEVLNKLGKAGKPMVFRVVADAKRVKYHIVDRSPSAATWEHDEIMRHFEANGKVEILGFWSDSHHGVFTHHGTNIHAHVLTADRKAGGHLEEMELTADPKLFVPAVQG